MQTVKTTTTNIWHIALSAVLVALSTGRASRAQAQQRELFTWNGRVDQEVQLSMRGRRLNASNVGPAEPGTRRTNVISALPHGDGQVTVQLVNGRGSVDVIQQPTAANGYTATIRIRDPQGGAGNYRLNAYWQPMAAGVVGPPFGRAVGRRGRSALTWSGDVDDNLVLMLRPNGLSYRTVRGHQPMNIESEFNGLPRNAAVVDVNQLQGRGSVTVVQQPSPDNGYTAMIRIVDPQSGYGHYRFDVRWR